MILVKAESQLVFVGIVIASVEPSGLGRFSSEYFLTGCIEQHWGIMLWVVVILESLVTSLLRKLLIVNDVVNWLFFVLRELQHVRLT